MARYVTWIDGQEATVELLGRGEDGLVRARIEPTDADGEVGAAREVSFELAQRPDGSSVLWLGGARRVVKGRVLAERAGEREVVLTEGRALYRVGVAALSERDAWLGGGHVGADEGVVTVSMPGRVVKVLVSVGDAVSEGQPVLIIEAMKMENEVKSGRDGVVSAIAVSEGEAVEADVVLMEIGDPE